MLATAELKGGTYMRDHVALDWSGGWRLTPWGIQNLVGDDNGREKATQIWQRTIQLFFHINRQHVNDEGVKYCFPNLYQPIRQAWSGWAEWIFTALTEKPDSLLRRWMIRSTTSLWWLLKQGLGKANIRPDQTHRSCSECRLNQKGLSSWGRCWSLASSRAINLCIRSK